MLASSVEVVWSEFEYTVKLPKTAILKIPKRDFKTNYRFMQVRSIAECSNGSILQYFQPSLSYYLSLRYLLCLFLSRHFRQVLLYAVDVKKQTPF